MGQGTPLQFIPIGAFLGVDESIPSLELAAVFSGGGNRNVYLDKLGRIRTILGYSQTSRAVLTSTNGAAMRVHGLYMYGQRTGNAVTRQLLMFLTNDADLCEIHVSYDNGVTAQRVSAFAPGAAGVIPDFAQLGNYLAITNDGMFSSVLSWDGNVLSQILNTQLASPVPVAAGAGQLSGNYQWRVVPIKNDGTRKLASVASAIVPLANNKATITWVADPDLTVTSYEVYRTTGTGKLYFYEGAVVGRLTVTFTTNLHDLEIIANRAMVEYGDVPPIGCAYCESHGQRMWYGVQLAAPRTWYYSDVGLPNSVYAENKFDFTDAESFTDIGVGAVGNFRKMFVAFLERSIWTVSGSGTFSGPSIDFTRRRTDAVTGTVSHRTIARVPRGARYRNAKGEMQVTDEVMLAYLTPRGDIRIFDGNNDSVISFAVSDTLKTMNYLHRRKAFAVSDKTRGEIAFVFPADANTEGSIAVVWNYQFGTWDSYREWPFGHAIETDGANDASVMLAGEQALATGAKIYKLWDGFTFNGSAINSFIETTCLYGSAQNEDQPTLQGQPLISFDKRWRWAEFLMQIAANEQVEISWFAGERHGGLDDIVVGHREITNSGAQLRTNDQVNILTVDGQAINAPIEVLQPFRIQLNKSVPYGGIDTFSNGSRNPRFLHSRGVRLQLFCISSKGGMIVVGANIAYQLLRGLKRDFVR